MSRKRKLNILDKLEFAMRYVYSHFLEERQTIEEFVSSQETVNTGVKYSVRSILYERMAATLQQVADAEARIEGGTDSRNTVYSSIASVRNGRVKSESLEVIETLIDEVEQYWSEIQNTNLRERIRFYNKVPRHVLALMIAMSEEFGWANKTQLDGLYREFRNVTEKFVNKI